MVDNLVSDEVCSQSIITAYNHGADLNMMTLMTDPHCTSQYLVPTVKSETCRITTISDPPEIEE